MFEDLIGTNNPVEIADAIATSHAAEWVAINVHQYELVGGDRKEFARFITEGVLGIYMNEIAEAVRRVGQAQSN